MIDIYSELDHSKVEQGWKPTRQTVNERKPSDLCIGDWSLKCRKALLKNSVDNAKKVKGARYSKNLLKEFSNRGL